MMGLSDSERISMIRSAVLIQHTRVTDGRTDGRTDGIGVAYTPYSIYAVSRKNKSTAQSTMYRETRKPCCLRRWDETARCRCKFRSIQSMCVQFVSFDRPTFNGSGHGHNGSIAYLND